mmetsp:Transcript_74105/g.120329  ORF Transcript_74105/g.120329 Transcript_74105/m.120329 type:complete len:81 (+) Transcript_74105:56-298(+)
MSMMDLLKLRYRVAIVERLIFGGLQGVSASAFGILDLFSGKDLHDKASMSLRQPVLALCTLEGEYMTSHSTITDCSRCVS